MLCVASNSMHGRLIRTYFPSVYLLDGTHICLLDKITGSKNIKCKCVLIYTHPQNSCTHTCVHTESYILIEKKDVKFFTSTSEVGITV